ACKFGRVDSVSPVIRTLPSPVRQRQPQRPLAKAVKADPVPAPFETFSSLSIHKPHNESTRLMLAVADALSRFNMSEGFFMLVPSRIGHSRNVDSAATAVLDAIRHDARRCNGNRSVQAATSHSYIKAVSGLRTALTRSNRDEIACDHAVLAAALLASFDRIHYTAGVPCDAHVQGISALLLARNPEKPPSELARQLLYWHWVGTFQIPVARGEPSPFETAAWLNAESVTKKCAGPDARTLSRIGNMLYIRLPRLIALVRSLRNDPADTALRRQTVDTARQLLALKDVAAENNILHLVKLNKTVDEADAHIIPFSFDFDIPGVFTAAAKYWQTTVILNILCLTIARNIASFKGIAEPAAFRSENRRLATNIMMCWTYAFALGVSGVWSLYLALLAAWAVTEDISGEFSRGLDVGLVRVWLLQRYNDLHRGKASLTSEQMDEAADLLAGGPLRGFFVEVCDVSASLVRTSEQMS
ncbi:hypothetical protein LTR56_007674, partial [Elasticomyces elasticus]